MCLLWRNVYLGLLSTFLIGLLVFFFFNCMSNFLFCKLIPELEQIILKFVFFCKLIPELEQIILKFVFFCKLIPELEQIILKFVWKQKKPWIVKTILRKNNSWSNHTPWLQTILQSYRHQNSMVLPQKQKQKSMQQTRKPRNKPTQLWSINLQQRRQGYTVEKRQSIVVPGKLDSYM